MKNILTFLFAPLVATSVLAATPAVAEHGHQGDRLSPQYDATRVFIGGAGNKELAQALRSRIYPNLRGDMRPARKARKADIRVRVQEMVFEPRFLPVKRKVKGNKVKVKERLRLRYAYQVTIFDRGRPIERFMVDDLAKQKVVYRTTRGNYANPYQVGNKKAHNRQGNRAFARNRAVEQVQMRALDRVARKVNRRLMRLNVAQTYNPRFDDSNYGAYDERRQNRNLDPRAQLVNMAIQMAMR